MRTLLLALLCPTAAFAAPTFSGDVQADFTASDVLSFVDPGAIDVGIPVSAPSGTISGFDMRDLRLHYDAATDTVSVGIDTYGVAGDADGDGNPDATSAWLSTLGGTDLPQWSGTESFSMFIDVDQDGIFDVIAGIPLFGGISTFQVAAFNGSPYVPGLAYGAPLPIHNGGLFATPNATRPDLEFRITNWSSLPRSSGVDASPSFSFGAFLGSLSDGGIGEDFNPGQGSTWSTSFPVCGDGLVQVGETCDDGNSDNTDTCTNTCQLPICGDTWVQAGEQCDDGNSTAGDGCDACALEVCGDGVVQPDEDCDDGNLIAGDGCDAVCADEFCGDGVLQPGEQCDDGNFGNDDGCSITCAIEVCGDGVRQAIEACDDGNLANNDGCSSVCAVEACGDGVQQATEQCDDGNLVAGDGCNTTCRIEVCGDGVRQGVEQCDDGNLANNDGCTTTCRVEVCGDGVQQTIEQCDDGNLANNDGCSATCRAERCGDGVKQASEQCDDGNVATNDGCSATCRLEVCGDGVKQSVEQCDDGNLAANDGCSGACRLEVCGDGVRQTVEACDDGNLLNLDGCSSTCEIEDLDSGCTYTLGWWKTHNKYARQWSLRQPWPISEDTRLAGLTWYNILNSSVRGDAWYSLAHQWIAATLNEANGASVPPDIAAAMDEAEAILVRGTGSCRSGWNRTRSSQLTTILDRYNNGLTGPGHCDDEGGYTGGHTCR